MKWALPALCVVLLIPLVLVDVPPLLDYPNHLARATVLAFGSGDPVLARMYVARWAIIPNLGTDLVLPPLLHILPVHLAGRIVVGLAILLPVIGTIAYSRATFGTFSVWPLASGLIAYSATLLLGFLNFVAAIGVALLLAAAWIAWRERHPHRIMLLAAFGTIALFFCHLMGLVFFCALIAGHELSWLWSRRADMAAMARRVSASLSLLVTPLVLYALSPLAPLSTQTEFPPLAEKARQLLFPFANYVWPLDIATACIIGAFLLACIVTGRCRITVSAGAALLLLTGLYAASPWAFKGTYFLDTRITIMLAFLLFGALLPTLPRTAAIAAATVFTLLLAVRVAIVGLAWHGHQSDVADLRRVIAAVEPGARVFVASVSPDEAPTYWRDGPASRRISYGIRVDYHLAALLLIEHHAYWPFLFDNPSQQPVETLQPYRELAERARSVADSSTLTEPGKVDLCGFDDLLLLEAGGEPDLAHYAADRLSPLAQTDFAALFRVRRSACARRSVSGN